MSNEKRLIDANSLKELVIRRSGNMQHGWTSPAVLLAVECQPTVDAVEVVHGHWIEHPNVEIDDGKPISNYECSECCCFYRTHENYCGFCGAKMDGERKDNERKAD